MAAPTVVTVYKWLERTIFHNPASEVWNAEQQARLSRPYSIETLGFAKGGGTISRKHDAIMRLFAMVLLVCTTQPSSMLLGFSYIATWRRHGLSAAPQQSNFVTSSLTQRRCQRNSRQHDMNCSHVAYDYLSNSLSPGFVSEPKGLDGLITYLMQRSSSEWHPDVIQVHEVVLTRAGEYEATINRRKHRAAAMSSTEEMKMLEKVDGFLMGLAKQMRRKVARAKISSVLLASTIGPAEFDKYVQEFLKEVIEMVKKKNYVTAAGALDDWKDGDEPRLLKVLKLVKDRIEAEAQLRECRPVVSKLAYAMQISSVEGRNEYLRHPETFRTVEELQNFGRFVENGVQFIGGGKGAPSTKSNFHPDKIDVMHLHRMGRHYAVTNRQ